MARASREEQLAKVLLSDIANRGLKCGDSYYSTAEVCKLLSVGGAYANRALGVLERRGVIERRQRTRAIIVNPSPLPVNSVSRISLLTCENFVRLERDEMSFFFKGVQSVFPKSILNIMYVPTEMNGAFIGELKSRLQESAGREAFILASVPYFVQAEFAKINCPSVILGSRHAGITGIPQIEENHEQGIQLIFEYLARRGRKNIIGLMRNIVFSGDLPVLDMFTRTATPFEKRLRCISAEPELLNAAVADLLRESPSVDAFICRSLPYVEAVCSAMKQKGLTPGKDVDVISCVHYQHEGCIALRREISLQETYTMGAELLKRIISGQKVEDYYVPVNLT